jgi:branched-chain amino acid transport system ATP-binding protein
MLKVEGLSKSFGGIEAMKDVSLNFPTGSLSAIIGPNGAGKTTFFNLVTGYLSADAGRVLHDGEDLVGMSKLQIVRRGVCRAFQIASLFSELTVQDSLAAAVTSHRGETWSFAKRFPSRAAQERASEIMEMVGLENQASRVSKFLPHGDQKLLDVALALALEPKVLLLDEPTAGMGAEERWKMIDKVQAIWRDTKITVIFIEHDMDIVFSIAQKIHVLKYGQVLASGDASEIRSNQDVIDAYLGTDAGTYKAAS